MSGPLFQAMRGFFEAKSWPVQSIAEDSILVMPYSGQHGRFRIIGITDEENTRVSILAGLPLRCPAERLPAMCAFIARANLGMMHGCFDLDLDDGELRFRVGADIADQELSYAFTQSMVLYSITTVERFWPSIEAVVQDRMDPVQAMALAGF